MSLHQNPPIARTPIRVLLVDDQAAVRNGLARLLACTDAPFRDVRTAATPAQALALAAAMRPHVVVLDVDLGGEDGLALIPQFARDTAVVVLTCHGDATTRARAQHLGANAFIEKHSPSIILLDTIVSLAYAQTRGDKTPIAPGASSGPHLPIGSDAVPDGAT